LASTLPASCAPAGAVASSTERAAVASRALREALLSFGRKAVI